MIGRVMSIEKCNRTTKIENMRLILIFDEVLSLTAIDACKINVIETNKWRGGAEKWRDEILIKGICDLAPREWVSDSGSRHTFNNSCLAPTPVIYTMCYGEIGWRKEVISGKILEPSSLAW